MTGTADPAEVVATTRQWLGTPYRHQASCRGQGTDCLGLVRGVWRALCGPEPVTVPPYTPSWSETQGPDLLSDIAREWLVLREGSPQPGDVLLFRLRPGGPVRHCGILIAPDRFVHAYDGREVTASSFGRWWQSRLAASFSFPTSPKG